MPAPAAPTVTVTLGAAWIDVTAAAGLAVGRKYVIQPSAAAERFVAPAGAAAPPASAHGRMQQGGSDGERPYWQQEGERLWMRAPEQRAAPITVTVEDAGRWQALQS